MKKPFSVHCHSRMVAEELLYHLANDGFIMSGVKVELSSLPALKEMEWCQLVWPSDKTPTSTKQDQILAWSRGFNWGLSKAKALWYGSDDPRDVRPRLLHLQNLLTWKEKGSEVTKPYDKEIEAICKIWISDYASILKKRDLFETTKYDADIASMSDLVTAQANKGPK